MFSNTTLELYYKNIPVTHHHKKYNKKNDIKNFDKSQSNESCSEDSDNSDKDKDKDKNNNETDEESEPGSFIYDMLAMEEYKE